MEPPWVTFPEIEHGSIGWRMGDGEEYHDRFYRWYSALPADAQAAYEQTRLPPDDWKDFYKTIRAHPWR
jgi:hypothetical protein